MSRKTWKSGLGKQFGNVECHIQANILGMWNVIWADSMGMWVIMSRKTAWKCGPSCLGKQHGNVGHMSRKTAWKRGPHV